MPNELIVKNGLKVDTTTGGLNLPVLTTTQRNALSSPAAGLTIYNSTTGYSETYNGTVWVNAQTYTSPSSNLFAYYNFI